MQASWRVDPARLRVFAPLPASRLGPRHLRRAAKFVKHRGRPLATSATPKQQVSTDDGDDTASFADAMSSALSDARSFKTSATAQVILKQSSVESDGVKESPTLIRPSFRKEPVKAVKHRVQELLDPSERTVRQFMRTVVAPTDALEPAMRELSTEELAGTATRLRARLADGASLDTLLPEAFAAVREAARRTLGMRHYGVQLIGGAVLHQGSIAEMRTGEGKTLVATLAAFLNALPGKGCHVVTVNDYLAGRDAAWMGRVYRALGMTCGCVLSTAETADRRAAYDADVTYVTSQELGFDYLRDNMAQDASELVLRRPFHFALVDEVDSVLIDEGRNPLLISTAVEDTCGRYLAACEVAELLEEGPHYTLDRKNRSAVLTEDGMVAAERALDVGDLWEGVDPWAKYILNAVKAKDLYLRDVQYIVRNGEVQIVDEFTGRAMPQRRWTDNIHQAVEAKEGVEVQGEQVTAATVTYQCFFQLYPKLAGMTGTARTEEEEFWRLYRMECVAVPTHATGRRTDMRSVIYRSAEVKWRAIADFVTDCHIKGSPVLVGTTSVEDSERLSMLLADMELADSEGRARRGVAHNLLNARAQYAAAEARIIAQAGRPGTITIATNMAGRGTDILLGGNPPGLARDLLERAALGALSYEAAEEEGRMTARRGAPVNLRRETEAALKAASELASMLWRGQMPSKDAASLMQRCIDAAENALRDQRSAAANASAGGGGASASASAPAPPPVVSSTGDDDDEEEDVAERALRFAAKLVLEDTMRQCEADGQLVRELGGLQVVGSQLHESRRIDNQLRGRAGRQGDPGRTVFVLSMGDELIQLHCPDWATRPLWQVAGIPDDEPVSSALLDKELAAIQERIERYYSGSRRHVAEYDQVLSLHRTNMYKLRRALLLDGQEALQQRMFRYLETEVRAELRAAGVGPRVPPAQWDFEGLLAGMRRLTAGRHDHLRLQAGLAPLGPPQFLPGVAAEDIRLACAAGGALPRGRPLPPAHAPSLAVAAAMAGVPVTVQGSLGATSSTRSRDPADWQPDMEIEAVRAQAAAMAIVGRVESKRRARGLFARPGAWALQADILEAYLIATSIELYRDRIERLLAGGATPEEVEEAERRWVLKAIDEAWSQHLATMAVLRNSCNLRSFGLVEPLEEYNIDGARAFEALVQGMRRRACENLFFFTDTTSSEAADADKELQQAQLDLERRRKGGLAAASSAVRSSGGGDDGSASVSDSEELLQGNSPPEVVRKMGRS